MSLAARESGCSTPSRETDACDLPTSGPAALTTPECGGLDGGSVSLQGRGLPGLVTEAISPPAAELNPGERPATAVTALSSPPHFLQSVSAGLTASTTTNEYSLGDRTQELIYTGQPKFVVNVQHTDITDNVKSVKLIHRNETRYVAPTGNRAENQVGEFTEHPDNPIAVENLPSDLLASLESSGALEPIANLVGSLAAATTTGGSSPVAAALGTATIYPPDTTRTPGPATHSHAPSTPVNTGHVLLALPTAVNAAAAVATEDRAAAADETVVSLAAISSRTAASLHSDNNHPNRADVVRRYQQPEAKSELSPSVDVVTPLIAVSPGIPSASPLLSAPILRAAIAGRKLGPHLQQTTRPELLPVFPQTTTTTNCCGPPSVRTWSASFPAATVPLRNVSSASGAVTFPKGFVPTFTRSTAMDTTQTAGFVTDFPNAGPNTPTFPDSAPATAHPLEKTVNTVNGSGPGLTNNNNNNTPVKQCAGCGGKIIDRFLLHAMDRYWHTGCLKCSCCQAHLGEIGKSCFTKAGMILCKNDYIRLFGSTGTCSACTQPIPANEFVMRAQGNVYHLNCFTCVTCHNRLVPGDRYSLINGSLVCEHDYPKVMRGHIQIPLRPSHKVSKVC